MPDLDLPPRRHSHLYEVKPMSRWWLVPVVGYASLAVWVNGLTDASTWALLFAGWLIGFGMISIFPKTFMSKLD